VAQASACSGELQFAVGQALSAAISSAQALQTSLVPGSNKFWISYQKGVILTTQNRSSGFIGLGFDR
jgi:hypothetical protein